MSRVFITYARQDVQLALQLHDELEMMGLPVSMDLDYIVLPTGQSGDAFLDLYSDVIANCNVMVLVHSARTKDSVGVRSELRHYGRLGGVRRVVCYLADSEPTDWVRQIVGECMVEDIPPLSAAPRFEPVAAAVRPFVQPTELAEFLDSERLHYAIQLVLRAGSTAMRFFRSALVDNRAVDERANTATLADHAANHEIQRMHKSDRRFGKEPLLSEESRVKVMPDDPIAWIVDPLDGTTNFRIGLPFFCAAVGLIKCGVPHLGAVFDPVENRVYFGCERKGSFAWDINKGNLRRLEADRHADAHLKDRVAGTHISTDVAKRKRFIDGGYLSRLTAEVGTVRALGSGQLGLALVASGSLDLFVQLDVSPWDVVAGAAIVRNAFWGKQRGCVLDLESAKNWKLGSRDIIAGSDDLIANLRGRLGV